MKVLVAFVLAAAFATAQAPSSAQQPDFLTLARNAIGGDGLAQVRSLHIILRGRNVASEVGDDTRDESVTTMHVWLHPPSRLLETISAGGALVRHGVDGSRLLGTRPPGVDAFHPERTQLRRFALTLLLYDPQALGVALVDEGTTTVNRKAVRVLHAADETGYDLRLYFDLISHRLVMSDGFTLASHGGSIPKVTPERFTYTDYRRVGRIELPFSLSDEIDGRLARVWRVVNYEVNPANRDDALK